MRAIVSTIVCVLCCGHFVSNALGQQLPKRLYPGEVVVPGPPNPARLKGMRTAVADIEAGKLQLRLPDSGLPAVFYEVVKEFGVGFEQARFPDGWNNPSGFQVNMQAALSESVP